MYVIGSSTCFSMNLEFKIENLRYNKKYFKMNRMQVLYAENDSKWGGPHR